MREIEVVWKELVDSKVYNDSKDCFDVSKMLRECKCWRFSDCRDWLW